jgi:hypothetical protein
MDKPPHLTLVTPTHTQSEHDQEFIPLPFYPFSERPPTLPLDPDECATAIHIAQGDLPKAADLLKVPQFKLEREVRRHPNLARILNEELQIAVSRSRSELLTALDSPSERRREWAASKILASRIAQNDPFAPAPAQPSAQSASLSLTNTAAGRTLVFRWRTDADETQPVTIDHEPSSGDDR